MWNKGNESLDIIERSLILNWSDRVETGRSKDENVRYKNSHRPKIQRNEASDIQEDCLLILRYNEDEIFIALYTTHTHMKII